MESIHAWRSCRSTERLGWGRALFSTEELEHREDRKEQGTEKANGVAAVSKAIAAAVCALSVVAAIISSTTVLTPFRTKCQQGWGPEQRAWIEVMSGLRSTYGTQVSCANVWPQLCNSSCEWNSARANGDVDALIQCDGGGRATSITMGRPVSQLVYTTLQGTIPSALGELTSLEAIDLSNCGLNGTVPSALAKLTSLRSLDLSNNWLTGHVPSLPFGQYTETDVGGRCCLTGNHFACPLPANANSCICRSYGGVGVQCSAASTRTAATSVLAVALAVALLLLL
jgi:hypothetical protein